MAANILKAGLAAVTVAAVAACAGPSANQPRPDEIRHFRCDDGTTFSAELTPSLVRLYTVTGTVDLPRVRGQEPAYFTNGLRAVIAEPDGTVRHAVGRRAWARCEVQSPSR